MPDRTCHTCHWATWHPADPGSAPAGQAPEPAFFRCYQGHGDIDAGDLDYRVDREQFKCADYALPLPQDEKGE